MRDNRTNDNLSLIPIMFCFDNNYVIPASVCFYSLLEHANRYTCDIVSGGGAESSSLKRKLESKNSYKQILAYEAKTTSSHQNTQNKIKLFYKLYVIHNDISKDSQNILHQSISEFSSFASLEFIDAANRFSQEWQNLGLKGHFAQEVLYKLLLASHFPQYDKIIVSDVDVVFLGDVSRSFLEFDCESNLYLSGVKLNDPESFLPLDGWKSGYKKYTQDEFNAVQNGIGGGYFIANLKMWRKDDIESRLIDYLSHNAYKLILAEQDVLNIVCYPKIDTLSPAHIVPHHSWEWYGKQWEHYKPKLYTQEQLDNARDYPIQLHYVGSKKPWNHPSEPKSDIWYKYLTKTPFLENHLNNLESIIINAYVKTTLSYRLQKFIKNNPLFVFDVRFYGCLLSRIYRKLYKLYKG